MIRRLFWLVFGALPIQARRGLPCLGPSLLFGASGIYRGLLAGVLLCKSVRQALTGAPWVESYSIVWRANLMGQPLCGSAADAGCEGREAMVMA